MDSLARLLTEIDAVGRRNDGDASRVLLRVADLFARGAPSFDAGQVDVFDLVLDRLVRSADLRARSDLAKRLAPLGQGPRATLCRLAHDEIVVARPVLTSSVLFDDQDLMAVAVARGRDHMLAICERPHVSECVTDVLVARGDGVVQHAIVANPAARFSLVSTATLLGRSRQDEGLLELLGERGDLSPVLEQELADIAREVARRRLTRSLSRAGDVEAESEAGSGDQSALSGAAVSAVSRLGETGMLDEASLARFAGEGRRPETVAALAYLSGLPMNRVEKVLGDGDDDLLVVIGRARDWSFATLRAIITARVRTPDPHAVWRVEQSYNSLSPSTAARILHFMNLRENTAIREPSRRPPVRTVAR